MELERRVQSHVEDYFPIFIRALSGKSVCIQIRDTNSIKEVKSLFGTKERMALEEAVLYFEGKILKDKPHFQIQHCKEFNIVFFIQIKRRGCRKRSPLFLKTFLPRGCR